MADSARLLLVEGSNDRSFFEQFCQSIQLDVDVRVAPPREVGGTHNSKQGAINHLATLYKRLRTGDLSHLAVVLDADQSAAGGGFSQTVSQVAAVLAPLGFDAGPLALAEGGLVFQHNDGLANLGLWVMPDNANDGILEDWIARTITDEGEHRALFEHAVQVVADLPVRKFNPPKLKKAEVASWLAWQDRPGEGLFYPVKAGLLDAGTPLYAGMEAWLRQVFGSA